MSKQSVTGLMNQQHEVHRLENLFYKAVDSAYYFKNYGLDWSFFADPKIEVSTQSFIDYFTQEATKHGIIMTEVKSSIQDFTLHLRIKLLSEETIHLSTGI